MSNAFSFNITAQSWLVADGDGKILQSENTTEIRSIASITKVMTAMVVLDAKQDMNEKLGQFTRAQHIQLALVKSSNQSAILLCDKYPGGKYACVKDMNQKAYLLGMRNTSYVEASGLSPMNISTAEDLIMLALAAKEYPEIVEASRSSQVKIQLRKKFFVFNNTNPIIGKRHSFVVSKTGTTRAAGGCILMMIDTEVGRRIIVVLGSRNGKTRIPEAEFIMDNYLGPYTIEQSHINSIGAGE